MFKLSVLLPLIYTILSTAAPLPPVSTVGEPGDDQQLKFNLLVVSTNSTLNGRYVAPMISTLFPEQEFWAFADYAPQGSFNLVDERLTYNNDDKLEWAAVVNDWTKGKPPLPALQFQSDNSSTGFGWNDQFLKFGEFEKWYLCYAYNPYDAMLPILTYFEQEKTLVDGCHQVKLQFEIRP